jgi:cytidylate kinase
MVGAALDVGVAGYAGARRIEPATLDDPVLRGTGAGDAASIVARIPAVRAALLDLQRRFAEQPGGAVLDGRDIGTVVCPRADVKIYLTANAEERARRRLREAESRGNSVTYEAVLADIKRRDERDSARDAAPMRAADDAILLDTSNLDIEAAFNEAVGLILRKVAQRGRA